MKSREGCVALDQDGKRCRRMATHVEQYHGDGELVGPPFHDGPGWVRAALCDKDCSRLESCGKLADRG